MSSHHRIVLRLEASTFGAGARGVACTELRVTRMHKEWAQYMDRERDFVEDAGGM